MKLNLGCGNFKKEGYINVDSNPIVEPDVMLNLNEVESYKKWNDNEVDEIFMSHVLEHLSDPFEIMKQLHRILKPGGILHIEVPHFSRGFTHAQHARGFDITFYYYYDKRFSGGYYGIDFELVKLKLNWMSGFHIKKEVTSNPIILGGAKLLNCAISFFANISPYFCSRIWCFWVGGFEEVIFIFRKPKDKTEAGHS